MLKKKISVLFLVLMLFLLSSIVSAKFKEGTCKNPNGGNYCGDISPDHNCYCDKVCTEFEDCCMDYQEVCLQSQSNAPQPPFGLKIENKISIDGTTVLSWSNIDGDKFSIYKNKNFEKFILIATTAEKTYTDKFYESAAVKGYGYHVTAVNQYGESKPSNIVYIYAPNSCNNNKCDKGEEFFCPSNCPSEKQLCGNGIIDKGEQCDGNNFGGNTCQSFGYADGKITCNKDCTFNYQYCAKSVKSVCGNNICEVGECKESEKCKYPCKEDCGKVPICGDKVCEKGEDQQSCPADCQSTQAKYLRYAEWFCYDGYSGSKGGKVSCLSYEELQSSAKSFCEGHCGKDTKQCGVKTFVVSLPCDVSEVKEVVAEQVKCVFTDSKIEQKCYSKYGWYCSGKGSCVVEVKGGKGVQIAWESSCNSGTVYTTLDGIEDYASFSCGPKQKITKKDVIGYIDGWNTKITKEDVKGWINSNCYDK